MTVTVAPTLAAMADVYRCSVRGGANSDRLRSYAALGRRRVPVASYNPMTSKPVLATVDALLAIDAEHIIEREASALLADLVARDVVFNVAVATTGMWTDRIATVARHLTAPLNPAEVLWWFEEPVNANAVAAHARAQAVRWWQWQRHGHTPTLADTARREGAAARAAGSPEPQRSARAAEVLDVFGDDTAVATAVAYLGGDEWADALGYTRLGLHGDEGVRHAVTLP